jgi:hypothetical protein
MKKVGVGVIGCGVISGAYLKGMDSPRQSIPRFDAHPLL